MVFEPVRCTLLLGKEVLGTVDAENSCVGQLKLRGNWCELKAKEDPSGAVAKGTKAPSPSIKCSPQV
jgi:hypothetical protein